MKLLGVAFFFLAVSCVCTGGEGGNSSNIVNANTSASKSVVETVNTPTSTTTTLQASEPTKTAIRATKESITSNSTLSSPNATQQIPESTTTQPPPAVTATTATNKSESTMSTTQANGTQLAQNESLVASSTKGWLLSSTISLQKTTFAPRTSGLNMSSPTESTSQSSVPTASDNTEGSSGKQAVPESAIHYSSVILPIVITLIVITLSVFLLVALYRMCQKKTPERQENGTEQAQSDKEEVKLLSVKTTSPETVFVEVRDIYEVGFSLPSANLSEPTTPPPSGEVSQGRTTGEHSSQGKSKTRQLFTPQQ